MDVDRAADDDDDVVEQAGRAGVDVDESDELDDPALAPDRSAMATVGARIAGHGDLLAPLIGLQQHLLAL